MTHLAGDDPLAGGFVEVGLHGPSHILVRIVCVRVQPVQKILAHLQIVRGVVGEWGEWCGWGVVGEWDGCYGCMRWVAWASE